MERRPPGPGPDDGFLRAGDARELRRNLPDGPYDPRRDGPTRKLRNQPAGPPPYQPPSPHQPPAHQPPHQPAPHRPTVRPTPADVRRREFLRAGKFIVACVSVLVLLVTGYAWATFQQLTSNLTTTPVISGLSAADGATDVLLVGSDSRVDAQGNPLSPEVLRELRAGGNEGDLTDTLILVRIPNDGSKAVGISIPRDSFVEIAGGFGQHKINSAYGRSKNARLAELREEGQEGPPAEQQAVLAGRKTLVETIEDLTGAGIDHYAEVNLLGFYEITQAIGGVEVCLNNATRDPDSGANFPAGQQTISGADALAFVRQRKNLPRGDLDRIVRQQVFMGGVANKVLSAGTLVNPSTLRSLIESLQRSVVLDDKLDPLVFAEQMRGIASGAVEFVTIPVLDINAQTTDGSSVTVDPKAVRQFVADQTSAPASSSSGEVDPAAITVDVRNASGVAGIAGRVMEELAGQGFTRGETANADGRATSVVRHASGEAALGSAVAAALGGLAVEEDSALPAGRVRVFVGEDYSGPGAQRLTGGPLVSLDGPPAVLRQQPTPAPITGGDVRCVD
ncbi:MAG TPA: LCP family protein [Pseudonocardiaceae bacterium]